MFTGRDQQLANLDELIANTTAPPVIAISGPPGVGKTTFAIHWASGQLHNFPDGDLFVDLAGHGPTDRLTATEVLAKFLISVGFSAEHLPAEESRRTQLLRRALEGRRLLVVLDNALDSAHIRPILPGLGSNPVLITGRQELRSLALGAEVYSVRLPELARDESVRLLDRRISGARDQIRQNAIYDLAALCGDLPLGLQIAAERIAAAPSVPIRELVDELRERRELLLDEGMHEDSDTDTLRVVFGWSIAALPTEIGRFFTRLGLFPGTRFSTPATAALAGLPVAEAERILLRLHGASLLERQDKSRFRVHDLIHLFARESVATEPVDVQTAAVRRLLDWYLASLLNALRHVDPPGPEIPEVLDPATTPLVFDDHDTALNWCIAEHQNMLNISDLAAEYRFWEHAWRTVSEFIEVLNRTTDPHLQVPIQERALKAAIRDGNRRGIADLLNNLGTTLLQLAKYDDAAKKFDEAREINHDIGAVDAESICIMNSGTTAMRRGQYADALRRFRVAIQLFERLDFTAGRAHVNQRIGDTYRLMGRLDEAANHYGIALKMREALVSPRSLGESWTAVGSLTLARGDPELAIRQLHNGLSLHRHTRDELGLARTLQCLAEAHYLVHEYEQASTCANESAEHYRRIADQRGESLSHDLQAQADYQLGNNESAKDLWALAVTTLRRLDDPAADKVAQHMNAAHLVEQALPDQRAKNSGKTKGAETTLRGTTRGHRVAFRAQPD
jgi:tetratricopeptide (TPR) repeat protein